MIKVMDRTLKALTQCGGTNLSSHFQLDIWLRSKKVGRKKVVIPIDVIEYTGPWLNSPLSVGDHRRLREFIDDDVIYRIAVDRIHNETHFICMSCIAGRGNCYTEDGIHRIKGEEL